MSNYFENLKWLVSSPNNNLNVVQIKQNNSIESFESPNNQDNINMGKKTFSGSESKSIVVPELDSELVEHSDSDHEYDKIVIPQSPKKSNYDTKQQSYTQIYLDLLEKEKLVMQNLDPDTVDKIKENYFEYLDSDVQIIKDFACVMENFFHIKERLKNFESDIKEFEQNIRTSNLAKISENKLELDEKISLIDEKIESIGLLMSGTKLLVDNYIDKITQLENSIKENETHRQEIISRLENFDKEHKELKKTNTRFQNIFADYQKRFVITNFNPNDWINYLSWGLMSIGIGYGIKFFFKNLISRK